MTSVASFDEVRAIVAERWRIEMGGDGLVEALSAGMARDGVIPTDDLKHKSAWDVDFPDFVALRQETDQIDASKIRYLAMLRLFGLESLQALVIGLVIGNQLEIQGERRITRIGVGIIDEGFVTKEVVCMSELFLVPDGRNWEDGKARDAIGFGIVGAGHVEEGWVEVFNEQAPAEHTRVGVVGREGKVAMVSIDTDVGAKEKGAKGAQGFDNGKEFLFDGGVVLLSRSQFAAVVGNGMVMLFDDSTELQIGGICVDVERRVRIGIAKEYIFGDERFHGVESTLTFRSPDKGDIFAGEGGDGCKNVGTATEHVSVEGDGTTECTNLSAISRRSHVKDGFDLFAPWFGSGGSEPKAKEIGFGNGPLTLGGVDGEAVFEKACEDKTKAGKVIFPIVMSDFNIVNIQSHILYVAEDFFHGGLSKIRGLTDSHGQTSVAILAKRCDNGPEFGRFVVETEGVILHGDVNFCEELVGALFLNNGLNVGQWIFLTLNEFVEHTEVGDPADGIVFLWNDEGTGGPK